MTDRTKNHIALVVFIVGLVAFLYPLADVIGSLNDWQEWSQPATAAKLIRCLIAGLVAVAGALGLDLGALVRRSQ